MWLRTGSQLVGFIALDILILISAVEYTKLSRVGRRVVVVAPTEDLAILFKLLFLILRFCKRFWKRVMSSVLPKYLGWELCLKTWPLSDTPIVVCIYVIYKWKQFVSVLDTLNVSLHFFEITAQVLPYFWQGVFYYSIAGIFVTNAKSQNACLLFSAYQKNRDWESPLFRTFGKLISSTIRTFMTLLRNTMFIMNVSLYMISFLLTRSCQRQPPHRQKLLQFFAVFWIMNSIL